jgi:hypothetical protein
MNTGKTVKGLYFHRSPPKRPAGRCDTVSCARSNPGKPGPECIAALTLKTPATLENVLQILEFKA